MAVWFTGRAWLFRSNLGRNCDFRLPPCMERRLPLGDDAYVTNNGC